MKAKKKPVETLQLSELGLGEIDTLEILTTEEPSTRQAGVIVESV